MKIPSQIHHIASSLCAVLLFCAAHSNAQNIFYKMSTATTLNPAAVTINPPSGFSYSAAAPVSGNSWNVVNRNTTLPQNTAVGSTVTYSANNQAAGGGVKDSAGNTLAGVALTITYYSAVTTGTRSEPSTGSGENTIQPGGVMQNTFRNYLNGSGNYFTYSFSGLTASKPFDLYLYGGTTGSGQGVGAQLAPANVLGANPSTATTPNSTAPLGGIWGGASPNYTLVNSNASWTILRGQSDASGNFSFTFKKIDNNNQAYLNGFQLVAASAAPAITGLADQTVIVGETVVLSPTVTGSAPISYQWQENGSDLSGETSSTLTLANVQFSQSGHVYRLIASNADGATTNGMTLTVTNQFTLNLDVNTSGANNYTGTAIAPDAGTYWNAFNVPAASSATLSNVRFSSGSVTPVDVTCTRTSGGNFSAWNNAGANGNPNPLLLMQDYLFTGPYSVSIADLPPGHYSLYAYAHGDNTGQASTVALDAANGGATGSTTDVGEYRNIYQAGALGNSYLKLNGIVGGARTLTFTTAYLNGFQLQLVSNNIPVAADMAAGTTKSTPLQLPAAKLESLATDPDGDVLMVASVSPTSTQGGTVGLSGGLITYTPPSGFTGADQFTFTLSDGFGGADTGAVQVTVSGSAGSGANIITLTGVAPSVTVHFAGLPNSTYAIERSEDLNTWTEISAGVSTGGNGLGSYTDTSAPNSAYYRTRHVP